MAAIPLPAPVVVTRHQCPFCRRYTRADPKRIEDHMTRCWRNPALRNCKTCQHLEPPEPGPYPEHPGWPEGCADGQDISTGLRTHCPSWQPTHDA